MLPTALTEARAPSCPALSPVPAQLPLPFPTRRPRPAAGILALPRVFSLLGIGTSLLWLAFMAALTYASMHSLTQASARTGLLNYRRAAAAARRLPILGWPPRRRIALAGQQSPWGLPACALHPPTFFPTAPRTQRRGARAAGGDGSGAA